MCCIKGWQGDLKWAYGKTGAGLEKRPARKAIWEKVSAGTDNEPIRNIWEYHEMYIKRKDVRIKVSITLETETASLIYDNTTLYKFVEIKWESVIIRINCQN